MNIETFITLKVQSTNPRAIELTKPLRKALRAEFDRTGIQPRLLLKGRRDVPARLNVRVVNMWLRGSSRSAEVDHLRYVCALLSALPSVSDCPDGVVHGSKSGPRGHGIHARIVVTDDMVARLADELDRTGVPLEGVASLGKGGPSSLTRGVLTKLRNASLATIRADHWYYIIGRLSSLPDRLPRPSPKISDGERARPGYRRITRAEFYALRHEAERTGITASKVLAHGTAMPPHLNAAMVKAWTLRQTVTAMPEHVEFVLTLYRSLPDAAKQ